MKTSELTGAVGVLCFLLALGETYEAHRSLWYKRLIVSYTRGIPSSPLVGARAAGQLSAWATELTRRWLASVCQFGYEVLN